MIKAGGYRRPGRLSKIKELYFLSWQTGYERHELWVNIYRAMVVTCGAAVSAGQMSSGILWPVRQRRIPMRWEVSRD